MKQEPTLKWKSSMDPEIRERLRNYLDSPEYFTKQTDPEWNCMCSVALAKDDGSYKAVLRPGSWIPKDQCREYNHSLRQYERDGQ